MLVNRWKTQLGGMVHSLYGFLVIHKVLVAGWMMVKALKIRTVFKTSLTLRRCLTKVKTPADPTTTKGVVYKVPCECGRVYVGETGGTLKQRITEHKTSSQECGQKQWTCSTCSWNGAWDQMGWSRGCMQGRTVDTAEDIGRSANQGTRWQPQFGHRSIHWCELESPS